jgi:hypothetical protein
MASGAALDQGSATDSQDSSGLSGGLASLPPVGIKRWVTRRKAEVVAAVRAGILTMEQACARYQLSAEEFLSWQNLLESHGVHGLRVTRLQQYRGAAPRKGGGPARLVR